MGVDQGRGVEASFQNLRIRTDRVWWSGAMEPRDADVEVALGPHASSLFIYDTVRAPTSLQAHCC